MQVIAASYLRANDLVDATFRVSRDGYGVHISLPAADACTSPGWIAAGAHFKLKLLNAAAFLRAVTINVGGQPGGLRSYQERNCGRQHRVYEKAGSGPFTTPTFAVRKSRWIVLLADRQGASQVDALRSRFPARPVATLTLTDSGITSKTLSGAGRFRLRIRGRGAWTVTVLE